MMKLETMQALSETLNEEWESTIADQILSFWEHDKGSAKYFRASANFQFVFEKAKKRYFLRFNHSIERTVDRIWAEVGYINHLAAAGIAVAKPIPSIAENFVESVPTPLGVFHAVVFEGLTGMQYEIEELTPETFRRWGKALGEIHKATQGYQTTGRPTWKDHLAMVSDYLPATEDKALAVLNELQKQLTRLPVDESNFGLIHFDFELDNIVWNEEEVGVIDFDDCAYYWFAADIAFALRSLFDDRAEEFDLRNDSFQNFVAGYRQAREIAQAELERIPLFLKLHNLITYAKLHRALGMHKEQDEPVWLKELREKLTRKMQFYHDEFSGYD